MIIKNIKGQYKMKYYRALARATVARNSRGLSLFEEIVQSFSPCFSNVNSIFSANIAVATVARNSRGLSFLEEIVQSFSSCFSSVNSIFSANIAVASVARNSRGALLLLKGIIK